ncbi:MAG: beta-ketoacyl-ACP synthase II [Firmicutes bacterium]|nr:beta-ketoacyl-ACP synthase II [Bacillota bacterium]
MRRVVVTGLGAVTPVGNDVETFWNNLTNGVSGIGMITKFDTTDYKVKIAAEVKDFDPLLYMEKGEARKEDLFSQYAVAAAAQAMNDSGLNAVEGEKEVNIDPERLGVYIGSGTGGMNTFLTETEKLTTSGPRKVSPFFIPMMIGNMATGNVAIRCNAQGPSLPVVTACATSTNAIGEAFRSIKHGYADAIIAGGSEATVVTLAVAGFTNCMALTQRNDIEAGSIPFDKRRDGFVMGEGAGIMILEEYEHAVARGAKIYAEIAGYGNTCDAHHMTAPHPEGKCAARAIRQAVDEANAWDVEGKKIYLNAHGTSTPLNDKGETKAIKTALGEEKAYQIHVSSTKSMTGHMLGAAGAVEAIATVLALKNGVIPPTIGYKEPDPDCDLDITPNVKVEAELELGISTSLGFGGHNGCLVFRTVK